MKAKLAARQGGKVAGGRYLCPCHYCGNLFGLKHLTFDHVTRKRDGGRFTLSNLVLACELCNLAREDVFTKQSSRQQAIFHRHKQILGAI